MQKAILSASGFLAAAGLWTMPAMAEYPDRPITFIVPHSAGGTTDVGARTYAPYLERCLGEGASIVVVNRPGAGGDLGFAQIASAAADGYTLGTIAMPAFAVSMLVKETEFKIDSFTYLGTLYDSINTFNIGKDSPYKTLQEVVDASKTKPLNLGLSSISSDDYLAALRFAKLSGAQFNMVPLGNGAAARTALIGGHVDAASFSLTDAAPFQADIRTLALAAAERVPALPDIPTFRELGYDHIAGSFPVISGPADLPPDVASKIAGCIDTVGADPAFIEEATKRSLLVSPMTREEASERLHAEENVLREIWNAEPWVK